MLRESAKAQSQPVNTLAVTQPVLDPLLPLGKELIAFVDAINMLDHYELVTARDRLLAAAGADAVMRAAAVCADFETTNRVVDAIGVPVNKKFYDVRDELKVTVPDHLR